MAARAEHRGAQVVERLGAARRRLEDVIGVIDRGLLPDEDAGRVERVQEPVAEQVVRARDVGPTAFSSETIVAMSASVRAAPWPSMSSWIEAPWSQRRLPLR